VAPPRRPPVRRSRARRRQAPRCLRQPAPSVHLQASQSIGLTTSSRGFGPRRSIALQRPRFRCRRSPSARTEPESAREAPPGRQAVAAAAAYFIVPGVSIRAEPASPEIADSRLPAAAGGAAHVGQIGSKRSSPRGHLDADSTYPPRPGRKRPPGGGGGQALQLAIRGPPSLGARAERSRSLRTGAGASAASEASKRLAAGRLGWAGWRPCRVAPHGIGSAAGWGAAPTSRASTAARIGTDHADEAAELIHTTRTEWLPAPGRPSRRPNRPDHFPARNSTGRSQASGRSPDPALTPGLPAGFRDWHPNTSFQLRDPNTHPHASRLCWPSSKRFGALQLDLSREGRRPDTRGTIGSRPSGVSWKACRSIAAFIASIWPVREAQLAAGDLALSVVSSLSRR